MANENFLGGRLRIFSQLHKEYMKPYMIENDISYNQYFYLDFPSYFPHFSSVQVQFSSLIFPSTHSPTILASLILCPTKLWLLFILS